MPRHAWNAASLLAAALLVAACENATEPTERFRVPIVNIAAPDSAAATDTVQVGFEYDDSCGSREVLLISEYNRLTVSVVGILPRDIACPAVVRLVRRTLTVLPSERFGAYTVTFLQPSGVDSVRTIYPR